MPPYRRDMPAWSAIASRVFQESTTALAGVTPGSIFATTLGVTRNFSIAEHPAYFGVSARYTGKRDAGYAGSSTIPSIKMPAYTLVDLQAGIDFQRFSLSAYVRNLTNKRGFLSIDTGLTANPNLVQAALAPSRTVGLAVNVPF